jgi:hypothetical protein
VLCSWGGGCDFFILSPLFIHFLSFFFLLSFALGTDVDFEFEENDLLSIRDLRLSAPLLARAKSEASVLLGENVTSSSKTMGNRILHLKKQAWANSTWKGMRTSLVAFLCFCFFYGLPPFPPTEFVLVRFAACLTLSFRTSGAISSYISSIRSVYTYAYNLEPPKTGPELSLILRGFRRVAQHRVCPVDALLPVDLVCFARVIDRASARGKAFWAAVLIGFYTFFRNSTLMPKSRSSSIVPHLLRSDVRLSEDCLFVSLRFSKSRQFNDTLLEYPIPRQASSIFCAYTAWRDLVSSVPLSLSSPAFSWSGTAYYYYGIFSSDLQFFSDLLDLKKRIRPHSLRRGGASTALKLGVPPTLIKLQGDWQSDAWLRYLEIDLDQRKLVARSLLSSFTPPLS